MKREIRFPKPPAPSIDEGVGNGRPIAIVNTLPPQPQSSPHNPPNKKGN